MICNQKSSNLVPNHAIFFLLVLLQQSGLFFLLPYFLIHQNGTIGLIAILGGIFAALAIVLTAEYFFQHTSASGFVEALQKKSGAFGLILGVAFFLFYCFYALLMLYSIVDITQNQLLEETPRWILCAITVLLAGWMSQGGPLHLTRLLLFCGVAYVFLFLGSVGGTLDLFHLENALPVRTQCAEPICTVETLQHAAKHSILCYSGFFSIFLLYPVTQTKAQFGETLRKALGVGMLIFLFCLFYTICVLGQYCLSDALWVPLHLARMIQISPVLERSASLFFVLWMGIAIPCSSLFLWCASETLHMLFGKNTCRCCHWGIVLIVFLGMLLLEGTAGFLQLEWMLAQLLWWLIPIALLLILLHCLPLKGRYADE